MKLRRLCSAALAAACCLALLSGCGGQVSVPEADLFLIQTDLSILEISASCGFQDQSYFIKTFRQKTGTTPLKFRKQL